jgi:hypothetical protein
MNKIKKIWLVLYTFLAIFHPPFLPVSLIYVLGVVTIFIMLLKTRGIIPLEIFKKSSMLWMYKIFLILFLYLIIISIIDFFIFEASGLLIIRLKTINQLMILTGIQFINIWYIIILSNELNYEFDELLRTVVYAGILQSICAILAYLFPPARNMFLHFGSDIYSTAYVLSRRAYGFSLILLDVFGYGMGLIAGYSLLINNSLLKSV